jgi:hypothetical protein
VTFHDRMPALHVPEGTIRMESISMVSDVAVGIGAGGTILLGLWLAFRLDGYATWDGWIVAAIVLLGGRRGWWRRGRAAAGPSARRYRLSHFCTLPLRYRYH